MNNRSGLLSTLSAILLFLVLAAFSIVLVVKNGAVQRFRLLGTARDLQAWGWTRTDNIRTFLQYRTENQRLVEENLQLQQQLARYQTAERMLDSVAVRVEPDFSYLSANIIKNTVDRQHNHLIIDRGRKDGIEPGLGVVTGRGVIGIVDAVGDHYAYVISILGAGQTVSAKLAESGAFGPMTWPGTRPDRMILREIPVHIQVNPGDTVVTSGYSIIDPPDIPLGSVVSTQVSQGASQELAIALFEDFRALHSVYVVRNNQQPEIEALYEQAP